MTSSKARLCLIAAMGTNRVIGADGALPWRLRTDLRRFKALTMGKPILMGRKTWESIGRALPGRANIVLSQDRALLVAGGWVMPSLASALALGQAIAARMHANEVCVIGGETLYAQTLALAERLYLTQVDASPDGDARFPNFDAADFLERSREDIPAGPQDAFATCYRVLDRRR